MKISRERICVLIACIGCMFQQGYTQLSTYAFTQSDKGFANASHGTRLGTRSNSGLMTFLDAQNPAGSSTATTGPGIPIGFEFEFNGVVYDRFGVMNSGWICLGRSSYGQQAVDIGQLQYQPLERVGPGKDTLRARISALDANLSGNGTSSSLTYELTGDSANHVLIVKWKNYQLFQPTGTNTTSINFEIRLHESDRSVHIRYGEMYMATYTGFINSNIGIGGFTLLDFANRKTPVSKNWNLTTAGTTFADDCVLQSVSIPPSFGLDFGWKAPACPGIPRIRTITLLPTSCVLGWNASPSVLTPQYEYALTTSLTPPFSGTVTSDTTKSFTGLIAGTQYYLHIRVKCDPMNTSPWTTHSVKTLCNSTVPPYYENFDAVAPPALPACMRVMNINPASQTWITADKAGLSGPNGLIIPYEAFLENDDWIFLQGVQLHVDTTYILSLDYFTYQQAGLLVYAGLAPAIDSMVFLDTFSVLNDYTFTQNHLLFTAPATDNYYFALRSRSADLQVDNIAFEKYSCTPAENIHVTTNEIANVVLSWSSTTPTTNFQYSISLNENYPPSGLQMNADTDVQFTNLQQGKTYYFFLRTSCGGQNYSPWQRFSFETKSAHDECSTALVLIPSTIPDCDPDSYSTKGATSSNISPTLCSGVADDDVWFQFVATKRSHTLRLHNLCFGGGGGGGTLHDQGSDTRSVPNLCQPLIMEIRKKTCGDSLISCIEIPAGTNKRLTETNLTIDSTYYIRIFGNDTVVEGQNFTLCIGSYPAETNNDCATALLLPVSTNTCPTSNIKDIAGATPDNTPVSACDIAPYYDLWYKFVTTSTVHIIEATFSDGGNGVIDVFSGTCGSLNQLTCANATTTGSEQVSLEGLTIGQTLYVRVFDATNSGKQMNVSICIKVPVVNDDCSDAIEITTVSGVTFSGYHDANSFYATGLGGCNSYYADDDVWYRFTAINDTHIVNVIPINPLPNIIPMQTPVIEMFNGGCNSTSLGCSATGDLILTTLIPGQEYHVRVYSANNVTGRGNFRIGISIPRPNITCANALTVYANTTAECNIQNLINNIGTGVNSTVWYKFIATHTTMSLYSDHSGSMAVVDACGGAPITQELYGNFSHEFVVGDTYYVSFHINAFPDQNYQYYQETGLLCIVPAPVNDNCNHPIILPVDSVCTSPIIGTLTGSTPSPPASSCYFNARDVWYQFTATSHVHQIIIDGISGNGYWGQVYRPGCTTAPIACFEDNISMPYAIASLDIFQPDSTYLLRVSNYSFSGISDSFQICINTRPINDICNFATEIQHSITNECRNPIPGSTINATVTGGNKNVWYRFIPTTKSASIVVTPKTPGFDPAIKLWTQEGGNTFEDCIHFLKISADAVHESLTPEVLVYFEFQIGQIYYIEVFDGLMSAQSGDFEICLFDPGENMTVYSALYETYPFDTIIAAGTNYQAIIRVTLELSGVSNRKILEALRFNLSGTSDMADIKSASLFIDTQLDGGDDTENYPFLPFGEAGVFFGRNPPPSLFGTTIHQPDSIIEFKGYQLLSGYIQTGVLGSNNFSRFAYLVMEISCDANEGNVINAICKSLQISGKEYTPIEGVVHPLPIGPMDSYDTSDDGSWHDGQSWVCGTPPPNDPGNLPVNIDHQIMITDSVITGGINVSYLHTLNVRDTYLRLGSSSAGALSGYSDKNLICEQGSVIFDHAEVDINGRLDFGNSRGDLEGEGICCDDGPGSYKLLQGTTIIGKDSTYRSVDYFPFEIVNGIASALQDSGSVYGKLSNDISSSSTIDLFKKLQTRSDVSVPEGISTYTLLEENPDEVLKLLLGELSTIQFQIPDETGKPVDLILALKKQITDNIIVRTAPNMQVVELPAILLYQGHVKGDDRSLVSMTVSASGIAIMISSKEYPNLTLKKLTNSNIYMVSNDHHTPAEESFLCHTKDHNVQYRPEQLNYKTTQRSQGDCIHVYIEVDHDIFLAQGSVPNAVSYILGLFNEVSMIYAAEDITLAVSEMVVWTVPSIYPNYPADQMLIFFESQNKYFNGDLGILLSNKSSGGIGHVNGLCDPDQTSSLGFVSIQGAYENVPQYSWPVYAVSHVLGHLLGSLHTHDCAWNGNNTPIDGCYPSTGPCADGPIPDDGGTIMSYCQSTPAGINFLNGFGIQPGNVMRYNVDHASCTQVCQTLECEETRITLKLKADNFPRQIFWELRDSLGQQLFHGGPYRTPGELITKYFCLPDGHYSFIILDNHDINESGIFVGHQSRITIDGNDGDDDEDDCGLRILTSNYHTENCDVNMLDPGIFQIAPYWNNKFDGTLTFGGGDDTGTAQRSEIRAIDEVNLSVVNMDSIIIAGGLASEHRHVAWSNTPIPCSNLIIHEGAEARGPVAVRGNVINNGIYTTSFLSFCGDAFINYHHTNTTNTQSLSGTGIFRSDLTDPIPTSQAGNHIDRLRIDNTFDGVHFHMPLNVTSWLRIRKGIIHTDSLSVLTLGDSTTAGALVSIPNDPLWFLENPYTGDPMFWDGGYVDGPFRRWFLDSTTLNESILPLGTSGLHRTMSVQFLNTNTGHLTAEFNEENPGVAGLPLFGEQGTNISATSPSGFWRVESHNTSGNYHATVNASYFTTDGDHNIQGPSYTRLIKRPTDGQFELSGSTTVGPSLDFAHLRAENFSGFSDFAVGLNCSNVVTNANDSGPGSLRHVLSSCIANNDTVRFDTGLSLIILTSDKIILNKSAVIYATPDDNIIIRGEGNHSVFEIQASFHPKLINLEIEAGQATNGGAMFNYGTLTLQDVIIRSSNLQANTIYNLGLITVKGRTELVKP